MEKKKLDESKELKQNELPKYKSPKIITYTNKEILEEIGPVQACVTPPSPILP